MVRIEFIFLLEKVFKVNLKVLQGFHKVFCLSLLPIIYCKRIKKSIQKLNYSFVIEEPETNLFPKAQYDLLKILEKDRSDDFGKIDKGIVHIYTTHSPFILSFIEGFVALLFLKELKKILLMKET